MRQLNSIQDRGGITQLLMKRLNMIGDAPVSVLMPELGANLVLENDRVEWSALKGETHWSLGVQLVAVVGERPVFALEAPAGAKLVCVVTEVIASSASSQTLYAVMRPTVPTITAPIGIINSAATDDRMADITPGQAYTGTSAVAVTGPRTLAYVSMGANTNTAIARNIVLTGRQFLCVTSTSANVTVNIWARGYMRRALPGELD